MIEKMPEEYKGPHKSPTDYTRTTPRQWTEKEIEWVKEMMSQGFTAREIAISTDRSFTSIAIKIKRFSKDANEYNKSHIQDKYKTNKIFLDKIQPSTILDLYAGNKSFYTTCEEQYEVITNDIKPEAETQHHKDALKLLCELYAQDKTFDLVDLDPYGSAYDCFDLAIKMAQKGLCITLGEIGHRRWKRVDFVKTHYGINNFEDFTIANLIKHIQQIGIKNKKRLIVFRQAEWKNIGRVWFEIKPMEKAKSQIKKEESTQMTLFDLIGETEQ